jgi:hypothetical protein
MGPLPAERFDLSEWSRARVNIDYHIAFDTNYYSVPYNLVQELVEVARRRRPSRSSTRVSAWRHTYAQRGSPSPELAATELCGKNFCRTTAAVRWNSFVEGKY